MNIKKGINMVKRITKKSQEYKPPKKKPALFAISQCIDAVSKEECLIVYDFEVNKEVAKTPASLKSLNYLRRHYKNHKLFNIEEDKLPLKIVKRVTKDKEEVIDPLTRDELNTYQLNRKLQETFSYIDKYQVGLEVKVKEKRDTYMFIELIGDAPNCHELSIDVENKEYIYYLNGRKRIKTGIYEEIFK